MQHWNAEVLGNVEPAVNETFPAFGAAGRAVSLQVNGQLTAARRIRGE